MDIITLVFDSRPDYLANAPEDASLLTAPLGTASVLEQLLNTAEDAGSKDFFVLPDFAPNESYERHLQELSGGQVKLIDARSWNALIESHELSDVLLIVDPRYWPIEGYDIKGAMKESHNVRWAVHAVSVGGGSQSTQEIVQCDDDGQVRRIGRYYNQVTWTQIDAIAFSLVPLASVEGISSRSLASLRSTLASRSALSRDWPLEGGVIDLSEDQGLLLLNEQFALDAADMDVSDGRFRIHHGVVTSSDTTVHPSAKLVGPVVIQPGVRVEENATILGPAVVGRNARVCRDALVAQSVLSEKTTVQRDWPARQAVAFGKWQKPSNGAPSSDTERSFDPVKRRLLRLGMDDAGIREANAKRAIYPILKLILDVTIAGISLVLLSPLLAIVAIAVKLDSDGPVFFGHGREGMDGKVFHCLKFRTMGKDAHQRQRELYSANNVDGPQFKLHNDPRVTRVGAWLRATNIDELPQLINVFLGQMSLVGPRPSPFRENQICVPWRRARLSVRPGITGLWQICRDQRSEGDFHQWIAYDIMYVRHLSFWLDVKIILATVLTLGGLWNVPHSWLVSDHHARSDAPELSDPQIA